LTCADEICKQEGVLAISFQCEEEIHLYLPEHWKYLQPVAGRQSFPFVNPSYYQVKVSLHRGIVNEKI